MGQKVPTKDLPFPLHVVGTFSCHGVEPGMRQGESNAKINQDRGAVSFPLDIPYEKFKCKEALFTVFSRKQTL